MTAIHRDPIDHPGAWTRDSLGGRDSVAITLGEPELDALDRLLARLPEESSPHAITRAQFTDARIDALMECVGEEIMNGRGLVILGGISPGRYDERQFEQIYCGLGTHLGAAAVQSVHGDRIGYVQSNPDDPVGRGYRSKAELGMHTDSYEIVGLMCVRRAASGGESGIVSSLAVHNELLRTRPELLAPLYRGWYYASDEAKLNAQPVTEREVPIYSAVDGYVSCSYAGDHIRNAVERLGTPLPDDLAEAIATFETLANSDTLGLKFLLEPGEIMLWHNYTNLHNRTAFTDDPLRRRLLLRLWLTPPRGRPCDPALRIRAQTYERLYREAREGK